MDSQVGYGGHNDAAALLAVDRINPVRTRFRPCGGTADRDATAADRSLSLNFEVDTLLLLGNLRLIQKNYEGAVQLFTQAINLAPERAEAYQGRGDAYIAEGKLQQAVDDFTQAIELDGSKPLFYDSRGALYATLGQHEQAIADFSQALKLNPIIPYAYLYRGVSYYSTGKYERALGDFNIAIYLAPDKPEAYAWRGVTYLALGVNKQQAHADLCRHLQLAGDNPMPNITDLIAEYGWQCSSSS